MRKNLKKALALLLGGAMLLTGCDEDITKNQTDDNTAQTDDQGGGNEGGGGGGSTTHDDEDTYAIIVNANDAVEYTLSQKTGKKGDVVTLDLVIKNGLKFKSIKASGTTLTAVTEGSKYTFTVGTRSVIINVEVTIEGDIIIDGEISAALNDDDTDGIFVAEGVKVPSAKSYYKFNYVVNGVKIDAVKMDESRCNANMQSTGAKDYQLQVAGGCTYNFYYDSSSENANYSVYAVRTKVDYLPDSSATLYSLFDGRMHSQTSIHPTGLTSIHYEKSSPDEVYNYDFKKFNNNTSFGKAVYTTDPEDVKTYYTYKNADFDNGVYKVVTTWPYEKSANKGNNEADEDLWDIDPHNNGTKYYQPYSASLDIVPTSTDDSSMTRNDITVRDAKRNLNGGAHYGSKLEYEIYNSIRGDFEGTAVMGAATAAGSKIKVTSTEEANGFKTVINSQLEYNFDGDSYEDARHYAYVYTNTMMFNIDGSLRSMDYKQVYYTQAQWNFSTHTPSADGAVTTIKVTNGFNEDLTMDLGDFNPSAYFINYISNLNFYNSIVTEAASDSYSILNYNDVIEIVPYGNGGEKSSLVRKFNYSPSTALDAWQYGVESFPDDGIIGINAQRKAMITNVGNTTAVFSNRTNNSNTVKKTISIKAVANGNYHSLFVNCNIPGYDSYQGDSSTDITAQAGCVSTYCIDAGTNSGAPIAYTVKFKVKNEYGDYVYEDTSKYVKVLTTGVKLTLDCNTEAANALTDKVTIDLKLMSDYYTPGWDPSTLNLTITPNYGSVVGTNWKLTRTDGSYTKIQFSGNAADGNGYRTGVIKDYFIQEGTSAILAIDTFDFKYTVNSMGNVQSAKVTACDIQSNDLFDADSAISTNYSDYSLTIANINGDGLLPISLSYYTSDMVEETSDYYFIIGAGSYDDEGYEEVTSLWGFTKE